jgi:hypothetical protein
VALCASTHVRLAASLVPFITIFIQIHPSCISFFVFCFWLFGFTIEHTVEFSLISFAEDTNTNAAQTTARPTQLLFLNKRKRERKEVQTRCVGSEAAEGEWGQKQERGIQRERHLEEVKARPVILLFQLLW